MHPWSPRARFVAVLALCLAAGAVAPQRAGGHGPCNCSFPQVGAAGARVTARTPAYKVIFNPAPRDYGTAMTESGYAGAYRPDAPTRVVVSRRVRAAGRRVSYRVPRVPPGVYLVLIFDGSEGGSHSTWDYFHVLGARRPTRGPRAGARAADRTATGPSGASGPSAAIIAAALLLVATGLAILGVRR